MTSNNNINFTQTQICTKMCLTVKKQKQKIFRQRQNSSSTLPSSFEHFRVKSPLTEKKNAKNFWNPRGHFVTFNSWSWRWCIFCWQILSFIHVPWYSVHCNLIGAILVLTSDLCRLSLPVSVRKLVLTLSLSVNYLHELIYINPIF